MSTPLSDRVAFLTANTSVYNALGAANYVILFYFFAIMIASVALFLTDLR